MNRHILKIETAFQGSSCESPGGGELEDRIHECGALYRGQHVVNGVLTTRSYAPDSDEDLDPNPAEQGVSSLLDIDCTEVRCI